MRAAIYLRVSTEEQRERQSIETQKDFGRRYCDLKTIPLEGFYADDGVSGTVPLEQRREGARLLDDARAKQFEKVLVYKLDRLGREPRLILNAVKEFEDMGVIVESMTEPFETSTPAGRFLLTILSGVAGLERDNILQRSSEGIGRLVREGAWVGGVVPFGYRVVGRHREARLLVSDVPMAKTGLTESDVIRLMFRMAGDEGASCMAIADHLNELGIPAAYIREGTHPTPGRRKRATSGIWRDNRIQYILRSPTYRGIHLYGKKPKNPARVAKIVERAVPAIVDADLWQRAQQTLTRNKFFSRRNSRNDYLLRGLVKCAHCGHTYIGTMYTGAKRPDRTYYVCGGRHKGRRVCPDKALRCRGRAVSAELEKLVWADVERFLRNPGPVLEELLSRLDSATETSATVESRLAVLSSALEAKEAERDRVIGLFRRGRIDDAALDKQLGEIEDERSGLRERIEQLRADGNRAQESEMQLKTTAGLLWELNRRLDQPPTWELRRQMVEALVDTIVVESPGTADREESVVTVTYRFGVPRDSIGPDTNRGIRVLQTLALPLGYAAPKDLWGGEL